MGLSSHWADYPSLGVASRLCPEFACPAGPDSLSHCGVGVVTSRNEEPSILIKAGDFKLLHFFFFFKSVGFPVGRAMNSL